MLRSDTPLTRIVSPPEDLFLYGNPDEIKRLLINLLDNALRHTPAEGSVTLSISAKGKETVLEITDTGTGIAAEHLPHLTERFYRADTSRARTQGGTGLGLAICKSIAEAHQGSLSIASVEGKGTVVRVSFPSANPKASALA